jgi:hypothetical protein
MGTHPPAVNKKWPALALLCAILLWSLALRAWRLDEKLFSVDEAESTINALTILDRGYPANRYLGLPLFENTLTEPWPDSLEYEFKDSSYSQRGLAIYHGWLPLYSIAASLKLAGVVPDRALAAPEVTRSWQDIARLTWAARAPSVLFGMLFVLLMFVMADELYGRDAAWGALLAGGFSSGIVDFARQARYYALATLLSAACCLLVWRVYRHGRWRDYASAAIGFALLFHTHTVAFLIACLAMALILPAAARRQGWHWKLLLFGGLLAIPTLSWIWLTGFLEATRVPRAWPYLEFPEDLAAFLMLRLPIAALLIGGSIVFLALDLGGHRIWSGLARPFLERRAEFRFLITWLVLTYVVFTCAAPAVSYSLNRLLLPMTGPGIVLAAGLVAAFARAAIPRPPAGLAAALLVGYLAFFGTLDPFALESARPRYKDEAIEFLRSYDFQPGTRLYATPNFHLILTVYTGLPVQSVAPVRKSFLDTYPSEILLIEIPPFRPPTPERVADAASAAGVEVGLEAARELASEVTRRAVWTRLKGSVARVEPDLDAVAVPSFLTPLIEAQPADTEEWMRNASAVRAFPAVFRGFQVRDWGGWWPVYFYRFVDPAARMGPHANYRDRLRSARAWVAGSGVTIYQCPAPPPGGAPRAPAQE